MESINKIVFGDNQFFGINHMSQDKAQQLSEKFYDINNIYKVYDIAFANGIEAIMLNSNDRAQEITKHFRSNRNKYGDIAWYPSIPYPHKYANLVAEEGIFPAISNILFKDNTVLGAFGLMAKGGAAVLNSDAIKIMQMLIDIEMRIFKGLNVKVIFLQNIVTDLLLGMGMKEILCSYCDYIRKKYNVIPGLITQNMPVLKQRLAEWGIEEVVICSSINKIGYLMSPSLDTYVQAINDNNQTKYQLMAMSTMASGAVKAKEAYEFINGLKLQSVVFGASSERNIKETLSLIHI